MQHAYVLALASSHDKTMYWLHNKIYFNEKQARNALKKLQENGKASNMAKVYRIERLVLQDL